MYRSVCLSAFDDVRMLNDMGQTAFSTYGETIGCTIVNEHTAKEDDPLIARLLFAKASDADHACARLKYVALPRGLARHRG